MEKKVVSAIRVETGSESDALPVASCIVVYLTGCCAFAGILPNYLLPTIYLPNYRPEAIGLPRHGENTDRITWAFREILASIVENIHV